MKHSAEFFAADDAVSVRPWRADVSGEKHPGEKKMLHIDGAFALRSADAMQWQIPFSSITRSPYPRLRG